MPKGGAESSKPGSAEIHSFADAQAKRRRGGQRRLPHVAFSATSQTPDPQIAGELDFKNSVFTPVPEKYADFLPKREYMYKQDLEYIEGLFERYGIGEKKGKGAPERGAFGSNEYFAAASELKAYCEAIRLRFSPQQFIEIAKAIEQIQNQNLRKIYSFVDTANPAGPRIHDLASIFHHHPKVRTPYLQIHAQKMIQAYPRFVQALEHDQEPSHTRETYFNNTQQTMSRSMKRSVAEDAVYTPEQVDTVGYLMGYDENGIFTSAAQRRDIFASRGLGTFFFVLRSVVDDAIANGRDVQRAVRDEFLHRDGVAFMLMRTIRHDFVLSGKKIVAENTTDETRSKIKEAHFTKGSCPAILKMDSGQPGRTQRPIAYEYAHTIVSHMPQALAA